MTDAELSLTERLTKEGRSFFEQMAQKIAIRGMPTFMKSMKR